MNFTMNMKKKRQLFNLKILKPKKNKQAKKNIMTKKIKTLILIIT